MLRVEVEEGERRNEDAEEQRDAAEARHRARVRAASLPRPVDDAEQARHAADRGRQKNDDDQRNREAVEDLGVGAKRVADHFVP